MDRLALRLWDKYRLWVEVLFPIVALVGVVALSP